MEKIKITGKYKLEAYRKGKLLWVEEFGNLITNAGKDSILNIYLHGTSQITTWYVGLISDSPTLSAADTISSHSGWTEVTKYSDSARQEFVEAQSSSQSITNSSNKAVFNINDTVSIGGAFLASDSTKGGSTGLLLSEATFTAGKRDLVNGDVLSVSYTVSIS